MMEWRDVTDYFTEEERHYNGKYLEEDEVYNEEVEVSIFSSPDGMYEIYFSFERFYGIVYVEVDKVYGVRDDMKKDLEIAYNRSKKPSGEFINWFADKYKVALPNDVLFNFDLEDFLARMP